MKPEILIIYGLVIAGMLYMRKNKKKQLDAQRNLIESAQEGTEVMTTSGMYGFIHSVEDGIIWLEIADGCVVRVAKAAISKVVTAPPAALEPPSDGPATPGEAD